uniref:hypothetical protein n=1 Tax=Prevotella sp. TaxID=59823 RepID=UPI0040299A2D
MANHNPVITHTLPTWVFIQSTASGNYRHEIQLVPSGFMVFGIVCDETGGGCSFPQKVATYQAAFETLVHFRPGAKLTERINGAGELANY